MKATRKAKSAVDRIDVKRCYLPWLIEGKCPSCDSPFARDLEDEYVSCPPLDTWFTESAYCSACEREWPARMRITLTVECESPDGEGA